MINLLESTLYGGIRLGIDIDFFDEETDRCVAQQLYAQMIGWA